MKVDSEDDNIFYSQPRLVHHLDKAFRSKLTKLYKELISQDSVLLDLMSSWSSHLPEEVSYKKVIGHGLNEIELEKNQRLDDYWIQDLNKSQILPLDDMSIDVCLMVAAWQYLQEPENIAQELKRVIKPGGKLIVSFSDRAFWTKAPRIWTEGDSNSRIGYIKSILISQGWEEPKHIQEQNEVKYLFDFISRKSDPFISVIATR